MAKKKNKFGINTFVKKTKPKIGRHKKRLNKLPIPKKLKKYETIITCKIVINVIIPRYELVFGFPM